MNRTSVFKLTTDDWYGSYTISDYYNGVEKPMLVEVIYNGRIEMSNPEYPDHPPVWRVSVWGNDDCGMEMDILSEGVAKDMFLRVISMKYVDRDDLIRLGFVSA